MDLQKVQYMKTIRTLMISYSDCMYYLKFYDIYFYNLNIYTYTHVHTLKIQKPAFKYIA